MNSSYCATNVEISDTGKVLVSCGYDCNGDVGSVYQAQLSQHAGFCCIPPNPTSSDACNVTIVDSVGGYPMVISSDDNRNRSVVKTLQPGETAIYAVNGSTIVRVKADKVEVEYNGSNKLTVTSSGVTIDGGNITINGTTSINGGEALVKRSEFNAFVAAFNVAVSKFNSHTHLETGGTTDVTLTTMQMTTAIPAVGTTRMTAI